MSVRCDASMCSALNVRVMIHECCMTITRSLFGGKLHKLDSKLDLCAEQIGD